MQKLTVQDWGKVIHQQVLTKDNEIAKLVGLLDLRKRGDDNSDYFMLSVEYSSGEFSTVKADDTKVILRKIEDLTEEEIDKIIYMMRHTGIEVGSSTREVIQYMSDFKEVVDYLDSIGIDQRGWRHNGLAVGIKNLTGGL